MPSNKGQIAIGLISLIGVLGGAWITGSYSGSRQTYAIEKDVALVKNTEELHYKELSSRLEKIDSKLDQLITASLAKKP